jgi:hypothetical protein
MVRDPAGAGRVVSATGVPLLIVAELPSDVHAWADALRRAHYPPERNRLGAHVTLFHGLPPSAHEEVVRLLRDLARLSPPSARITGIMDLERGTAFAIESPEMVAIHADMAERLHGLVQQKDTHPLRLHITVQNKVAPAEARALQAALAATMTPRTFRFRGFGLYGWTGDLWRQSRVFAFRGGN